jgi:hypothetical protein
MHEGKLAFYHDNLGEPYILREEFVDFVARYLQRPISGRE